jgi:hypothetical protein
MSNESPNYHGVNTIGKYAADAPDGASHRRATAGPPAAPRLDKRTFLVDHTSSHAANIPQGHTWSIKIHDFGKQWMEASWGKIDALSGKKGHKGRSTNGELNEKRARARATGAIQRKCISIGADHLVTLTYRRNVEDREQVLTDLERLRRMLSRSGLSVPYVAVLECQKRGAIHPHLAVKGYQDIRLLRRCWYKIVGNAQGQVHVRGPRPGSSPVKLARYLSKYLSKDMDSLPREFEEYRYFCSLRIKVPTEQIHLLLNVEKDVALKIYSLLLGEMLDRMGNHCRVNNWMGGAGTFGWIAGFEDPFSIWISKSPVEPNCHQKL